MFLVELLTQTDQEVVVLDRVCDGSELLRDLSLIKQVGNFRPIVLVLSAKRI